MGLFTQCARRAGVALALLCSALAAQAAPGDISTYAGAAGANPTSLGIGNPSRVATDAAGNVYISTLVFVFKLAAETGLMTIVAGNGSSGFGGDGGLATLAQLNHVEGMAVDASGNLYIADKDNHRVRKVDTTGYISTVAGTGVFGFSGDGGAATAAKLNAPQGVAVDAHGNLYIADNANHRIRKVSSAGIISTVAGTGTGGFSGDGGPATLAKICYPGDIASDTSGNLFISSNGDYRIRKVDVAGNITTVAGNGTSGFSGDGGAATSAQLNNSQGISLDASGNLYIGDYFNHRVRKVNTSGIISTVAGNGVPGYSGDGGAATAAQLNYAKGVAIDGAGNLYIADEINLRIRKLAVGGTISTVAGNGGNYTRSAYAGDGGPATAAVMNTPVGGVIDASGNFYFVDAANASIRKVSSTGTISTVAGNGTEGFSGDGGGRHVRQIE